MSSPALLEPSGLSSLDKVQPGPPARRGSLSAVNFLLNALRDGFQGKRFLILLLGQRLNSYQRQPGYFRDVLGATLPRIPFRSFFN